MGNNISGATTRTALGALDSYVSELGADITYEKRLVEYVMGLIWMY